MLLVMVSIMVTRRVVGRSLWNLSETVGQKQDSKHKIPCDVNQLRDDIGCCTLEIDVLPTK
jgi:hypothetical protein